MSKLPRRLANIALFLHLIANFSGTHCFQGNQLFKSNTIHSYQLKQSSTNCNEAFDSSTKRTSSDRNLQDITTSLSTDADTLERVPSTLRSALHRFFLGKDHAPILALTAIIYFIYDRISLHSSGSYIQPLDGWLTIGSIIFWWFQEHFMHGNLLHSQKDWMGKQIHEEHHKMPYFHISIDSPELVLGWLFTVHALFRLALPLPLAISATIGYSTAGLFYEWAHYIVHTRVKPKGNFFRKMRDHHMRHHLVNEKYWLGFSIPQIDDIFGTNPSLEKARKRTTKLPSTYN